MRRGMLQLATALSLCVTTLAGTSGCTDYSDDSSKGGSMATGTGGAGTGGAATGGGGGTVVDAQCTNMNVAACGGDLTGTWNVASSCLELTGDMDVTLTSLGCPSVPVTGSLEASGSLTFNANGSYTDNTKTTGSVSFPLDPSCLSVSSVDVACSDIGSIFEAVGWSTASCSDAAGQCQCTLTVDESGGLGSVLPYFEMMGAYTTTADSYTAGPGTFAYCAETDKLTVTPQMSALTGQVVLVRDGVATSTGGSSGTGGAGTGGAGTGGSGTGGSGTGGSGTGGGMGSGGGAAVGDKPCDIYAASGLECVAAHSTVRALYKDYSGNLYQVKRADGQYQDIPVASAGGFADSSVQDAFCSGSSCTIWRLYDQSGHGNFLEAQTPNSTVRGNNGMTAANAAAESLMVGGNQVYSLFTRPAQAYWNDGSQNGMPRGQEPQGVYMVTSGTHYNGGCCYNYGNAQLDRNYHGGSTMDSVYFGSNKIWGTGEGSGPWVMADMEDGMLAGGSPGNNPNNLSLPHPFVTAIEKNDGQNFALKGADATQSTLTTMYEGPLPGHKIPMKKEGAVILGAGGDCCYSNNNASEGTFYEGAIVAGYPDTETDNAIHANVVEAGYGN